MIADPVLAYEARVLGVRLDLGLVKLGQIGQWADAAILRLDAPPDEFSVLCLAQRERPWAVRDALTAIGGDALVALEIVAALATADAITISSYQVRELAETLAGWAIRLNEDSEAGHLLFGAYEIRDEFDAPPEFNYAPNEKRARAMLADLVGRAHKLVTKAS